MPPWKAVQGYGEFRDEALLSTAEKDLLKQWAAAGAPRGNPADEPPVKAAVDGWRLGKPDLIVTTQKPCKIPAEGARTRDYLIDALLVSVGVDAFRAPRPRPSRLEGEEITVSTARLGIQLIIFRDRPQKDLAGVLRDVARAGYEGVEAGNLFRGANPAQIQALFAENGLALTGAHAGYGEFTELAKVEEDIQFLKAMNARPDVLRHRRFQDMAGYEQSAEVFNRVGRRCLEAGIQFCYHNHNWEFTPFDGQIALHRLAELDRPAGREILRRRILGRGGRRRSGSLHPALRRPHPVLHVKDGQWDAGHPGKATASPTSAPEMWTCRRPSARHCRCSPNGSSTSRTLPTTAIPSSRRPRA